MRLKSPEGLRISRNSSISGWRDVEIAGGRAAAQRALADRQRQRIHHADERDDAAGLAVEADRLADAADVAPIGADAAAARGQPDILVPGADDAFEAVGDRVEIAGDRQAAPGAAVRQHRRRRHEPQLRDIVVEPLGVLGVVGIGRRRRGRTGPGSFRRAADSGPVSVSLPKSVSSASRRMIDLDRIELRRDRLRIRAQAQSTTGGDLRVLTRSFVLTLWLPDRSIILPHVPRMFQRALGLF